MPILLILSLVGLLAALAWWYEEKYGISGPFHGDHGDEEGVILPPKAAK